MTCSTSFRFAAFLSVAILSGCATRLAVEEDTVGTSTAVDAASSDVPSPDGGVTSIVVASDASQAPDTGDAGGEVEPSSVDDSARSLKGTACGGDGDCQTGSCVDGVCCGAAACDVCQSCAVPGALGRCAPLPVGDEDPRSCTGAMACDGKGHCAEYNGNACQATTDCLSGFCVDGVCCETACDQACFSCSTAFEVKGTCQPLTAGEDDVASSPCNGTKSCGTTSASPLPMCLLNEGQPCATATDCVSGQCSTFYADRDGDTFGNPASFISICAAPDAPPAGYVVVAGDCCDADSLAHPGQLASFAHTNACGRWDFNCDGVVQKEFSAGPCSGYSAGAPADCGKTCDGVGFGVIYVRYTQACR